MTLVPGTETQAALAEIIRRGLSGESLPASDTREFRQISELVAAHLKMNSDKPEIFGMYCLSALIDACQARIAADQVLRDAGERK